MKYNIRERIVLIGFLPLKGDISKMSIVKDLSEKIKFSQREKTEAEIKVSADGISWAQDKDGGKEIKFNEMELTLLKEQIDKKNEAKEITLEMLSLVKKIKDLA